MPTDKVKLLRCPRCGNTCSGGKENPWRPFCSERCQTVDLGGWFSEQHRIPGGTDEKTAEDKNGADD